MQCPQCNSENTQRLRVVYEGGTSSIQTTSRSAGVGVGSGFMSGGGVTKTSGVAQSGLAANASPPAKKPYGAMFAAAAFLTGAAFYSPTVVLMWPIAAIPVYVLWRRFQFNRDEWPRSFAAWDASWMCHKCGHMYELTR